MWKKCSGQTFCSEKRKFFPLFYPKLTALKQTLLFLHMGEKIWKRILLNYLDFSNDFKQKKQTHLDFFSTWFHTWKNIIPNIFFLIFLSVSHDKERVSRFLDVPAWRLRVSHLQRRVQQVAAGPGSPTSSRCRLQSTTWVHWNTERRWNLNNCCAVWWSGRRCGRFTSAVSESIFTTNQFIVYSKTRSTTVKNVYLITWFFC